MNPWIYACVALLSLLLATSETGQAMLAEILAGVQGRGGRVGPRTAPDGLGVIREDPRGLADAAGLDLGVYALARMLASEHGGDPAAYKAAIGWAAVNAAGGPSNVAGHLLAGKADTAGRFARQNARYLLPGGETAHAGKYASTAIDPREDDVAIASAILGGYLADPTRGATNFFSPRAQDAGFARGLAGYTRDAAGVDAAWRGRGLEPVSVPDVDPARLAFYRPAGGGVA